MSFRLVHSSKAAVWISVRVAGRLMSSIKSHCLNSPFGMTVVPSANVMLLRPVHPRNGLRLSNPSMLARDAGISMEERDVQFLKVSLEMSRSEGGSVTELRFEHPENIVP